MNRVISAGVALGMCLAATAADFTWTASESSGWQSKDSYSEAAVPSAGDTVTIAKNCIGVVNDDNFAFVASLGKIVLMEHAELRFDVTGEKDFPVPAACYTTSSRTERSQITKNGAGVLSLSGGKGEMSAYRVDLVVNAGNLKLYPNETSGAYCDFNSLTIASNATLTLPPYRTWTRVRGKSISVEGTIHCPFDGMPNDSTSGGGPLLQTLETEGEISGRLADYSILTSDNPRTEDPYDILRAVEEGIKRTNGKYEVIENRREAIRRALQMGEDGDIIVLAGKGHETYQEIMGVKRPFDEKVVVRELLQEMNGQSTTQMG